jgi:hypothetical protein
MSYCAAPLYKSGVYPHFMAMPRMPLVADFAQIPNMGVLLMSCIMAIERMPGWKDACQNRLLPVLPHQ